MLWCRRRILLWRIGAKYATSTRCMATMSVIPITRRDAFGSPIFNACVPVSMGGLNTFMFVLAAFGQARWNAQFNSACKRCVPGPRVKWGTPCCSNGIRPLPLAPESTRAPLLAASSSKWQCFFPYCTDTDRQTVPWNTIQ